jgi:hypothetical protein
LQTRKILGCLVDGGAAINVIASWFINDLGLSHTSQTSTRLKVADQSSIPCQGILGKTPITVNELTIKTDFHFLNLSETRGGYPIILGRPWLKVAKAIYN